jgi:hypothetical protein
MLLLSSLAVCAYQRQGGGAMLALDWFSGRRWARVWQGDAVTSRRGIRGRMVVVRDEGKLNLQCYIFSNFGVAHGLCYFRVGLFYLERKYNGRLFQDSKEARVRKGVCCLLHG